MTGAIKVSISDLREGLGLLLDEIERRHGSFVDLGPDYYWVIDREASHGLDPPQLADVTVGQLSDDVASLQDVLAADDDRPIEIWHDLTHVVGILSRLAAIDAPSRQRP